MEEERMLILNEERFTLLEDIVAQCAEQHHYNSVFQVKSPAVFMQFDELPPAPKHTDLEYEILEDWVMEVARQNQVLYEQRYDRDVRIKELEAELELYRKDLGACYPLKEDMK